ncbi:unnamed protein product, partial [Prorocentrum cordatum]
MAIRADGERPSVELRDCDWKNNFDEQSQEGPANQSWMLLPESRPQVDVLTQLSFPLRTSGRYIVDSVGKPVKLVGVNWIGAHMEQLVNNGLHTTTAKTIAARILRMGFNSVRLGYALNMEQALDRFLLLGDGAASTAGQSTIRNLAIGADAWYRRHNHPRCGGLLVEDIEGAFAEYVREGRRGLGWHRIDCILDNLHVVLCSDRCEALLAQVFSAMNPDSDKVAMSMQVAGVQRAFGPARSAVDARALATLDRATNGDANNFVILEEERDILPSGGQDIAEHSEGPCVDMPIRGDRGDIVTGAIAARFSIKELAREFAADGDGAGVRCNDFEAAVRKLSGASTNEWAPSYTSWQALGRSHGIRDQLAGKIPKRNLEEFLRALADSDKDRAPVLSGEFGIKY